MPLLPAAHQRPAGRLVGRRCTSEETLELQLMVRKLQGEHERERAVWQTGEDATTKAQT